jgi:tetratricopeptide (TPR) repeat protein
MSSKASPQKARKLFVDAATRLQRGDAAGARRGLEKVSRMAPGSAAVWYNLALAGQHLGLHSKAIREYEKSLRLAPDQVDALVNIGLSHKHLGDDAAAMVAAQKALKLVPDHPRALNLMGTLLAESGDSDAARDCFRKALDADPANADARQNLANAGLESGNAAGALEILSPLLGRPDTTREQQEIHGRILLELGRFDQVQPLIRELKKRYPDEESVLILEMSFCELIKDHFSVVDIAQNILSKSPQYARVWNSLGSAYFQLDSIEKAKDSYQKAIDYDPDHPEYRNNIGLAYASLGDKEQAEKFYRESIALNEDSVEAYRNLVAMRKFKALDDPDVERLEALWERDDHNDQIRCKLAFALGKVYDDCGMYDRAFETYQLGNRLKSREITMDFDQYFSHIDRIIEVFDRPPAVRSNASLGRPSPIFILGMSRSGTTLVEQIIARHPEVTGCGELPCIDRAIGRLEKNYGRMRIYPDDFPGLEKDAFDRESREYLDWVGRLHDLSAPFFTDKMPFNFVHVWLIRVLFPDAAIIHCHRHPLDVIISNYFQLYGSEINFVYDLEILARYYIRHYHLMQHWHRIFPGDIYKVQYEALVADSENQTRNLIAGARLEWNDVCLDQKRASAAVRTASIWQVRQGIYTSSRERWRHYEKQLAPAIDILRAEGILDAELHYVD